MKLKGLIFTFILRTHLPHVIVQLKFF